MPVQEVPLWSPSLPLDRMTLSRFLDLRGLFPEELRMLELLVRDVTGMLSINYDKDDVVCDAGGMKRA